MLLGNDLLDLIGTLEPETTDEPAPRDALDDEVAVDDEVPALSAR